MIINDGGSENSFSLDSISGIIDTNTGIITSSIADLSTNFSGVLPGNFNGSEFIKVNIVDSNGTFNLSDSVEFPDNVILAIAESLIQNAVANGKLNLIEKGQNVRDLVQNYIDANIGSSSGFINVGIFSVEDSQIINNSGDAAGVGGQSTNVSFSLSHGTGTTKIVTFPVNIIGMTDDGEILEGSENGEIITIDLAGYTFVDPIDGAKFTLNNLPTGVTKGSVTRVNGNTVTIALSGNTTGDYDTNINDVNIDVNGDQIDVYTGSNLNIDNGVTLEPVLKMTQTSITQGSSSDYSATFFGEQDSYTMKITSNEVVDEDTQIFLDQNEFNSLNVGASGGILTIKVAKISNWLNEGVHIEGAITALGTIDGVDYSTWTVNTSSNWNSGENGHRFYRSGSVTATISGSTDVTEVVNYNIDDIIKSQDIVVRLNGRDYDVNVYSNDTEADVANRIISVLNGLSIYFDRFYSYSNPSGSLVRLTSKLPNTDVEDVSFSIRKK